MATDEEIYKILMRVEGEDKVRSLSQAIGKQEENLLKLIAAHGAQSAAARASADAVAQLNQQLKVAEAQVNAAGGSTRNLAHGFLEFSRAAEDAQYGIAGVLNNIPGMVMALGGGAGLTGAISLAAVAGAQLYKHWDELAGLFGGGHTKTQAEQMEELSKKTGKTADETARLLKYEQLRQNVKAQQHGTDRATSEREKAVNAAVVEGPVEAINKGVEKIMGRRFENATDQRLIEERDSAASDLKHAELTQVSQNLHTPGMGDDNVARASARVKAAADALNAAYGESVEGFLAELARDKAKLQAFARQAAADPGAFGPGGQAFADRLMNAAFPVDPNVESAELKQEQDMARDSQLAIDRDKQRQVDEAAGAGEYAGDQSIAEAQEKLVEKERQDKVKATIKEGHDNARAIDQADADARKQDSEAKQRRKEAVDAAKDSAPGVETLIKNTLKGMLNSGMSPDQARAAVGGKLNDAFGGVAGGELTAQGIQAAQEERMMDYINKPLRNSEVIGAEGLADSIQSGVGDDTNKKQLEVLNRSYDMLVKIANARTGGGSGIVVARADGNIGLMMG